MIEPATFREQIVEALKLASSPASQLKYAQSVPIADVVGEIFETWHDIYHPSVPTFALAFDRPQREALAQYASVLDAIGKSAERMPLGEFQSSPFSSRLAEAAERALTVVAPKS